MHSESQIPLHLFFYILIFFVIQLLILRTSSYIKAYINNRNKQIIDELKQRDLKELIALRQALREDKRFLSSHPQWMLSLVIKAINIKVLDEVDRRNKLIQQQLALKEQADALRKKQQQSVQSAPPT